MLRLSSFFADVLGTVLTGFSTASSAVVTAADSILTAIGKLQAQVSLSAPVANPTFTGTAAVSGSYTGTGSLTLSSTSGTNTLTLGGATSQGWFNLWGPNTANRNVVFGTGNAAGLYRRWQWVISGGTENATGATVNWAVNTAFALNVVANNLNNSNCYQVTTAGTSATSGTGPSGTGTGITDGTVVWKYLGVANAGSDFSFLTWDDVSSYNMTALQIIRSSRLVIVSYSLQVTLSLTVGSGASFGSLVGSSSADFSKHLQLYSTTYGIGITAARQNYGVPTGSAHKFMVNGADIASLDLNGVNAALGLTTPAAANLTMQNGGALAGFRNVVMNGNFDIWQRGYPVYPVNGSWLADRWGTTFDGSGSASSITFTPLSLTSTYAILLNAGITNCLVYSVTTAGSGGSYRWLIHNVENVRTLAGSTVTLSFYAWCASGTFSMAVGATQYFGSGGSPSANVAIAGIPAAALTTTPTRFSVTFALPSIVGTTMGTNGNSYVQLAFMMPVNLVQAIGISGVVLEPGPVATPVEIRPQAVELAMCQRYLEVIAPASIYGLFGGFTATAFGSVTYSCHVAKRATPTFTCASWSLTNAAGPYVGATTPDSVTIYVSAVAAGNVQFYNTAGAWIAADL